MQAYMYQPFPQGRPTQHKHRKENVMQTSRFVVFKTTAKQQWYFRLQAANSETVLGSEGYTTKDGCLKGIASVKTNAPNDARYDRRTASNGQFYFVLKAANGEIIGTSEMYQTTQGRETGIQAVKTAVPVAILDDRS
jgi:uncharacterized protein YegP (UPF0339 family)